MKILNKEVDLRCMLYSKIIQCFYYQKAEVPRRSMEKASN